MEVTCKDAKENNGQQTEVKYFVRSTQRNMMVQQREREREREIAVLRQVKGRR